MTAHDDKYWEVKIEKLIDDAETLGNNVGNNIKNILKASGNVLKFLTIGVFILSISFICALVHSKTKNSKK